jgi:hypothetical protein
MRVRNGTKAKHWNIFVVKLLRMRKIGFKLSAFGQFLFLSALLWLSLKSKSSSFVRENKRKLHGNISISSELVIMSEKQFCIWISSRDVIQRKFYMPTKRYHLVEFKINRKNSHLLLYILLSGDIATNPGPANRNCKSNLCRPLNVFYQNVRSLESTYWDYSCNSKENKLSCCHDIISVNQFDVIALTETWLDNSISITMNC